MDTVLSLVHEEHFPDTMQDVNAKYDIKDLREAIPPHCFKPSYMKSLGYLARDLLLAGSLMALACTYIPQIDNTSIRGVTWALYGFVEGLVFTGLWVSRDS